MVYDAMSNSLSRISQLSGLLIVSIQKCILAREDFAPCILRGGLLFQSIQTSWLLHNEIAFTTVDPLPPPILYLLFSGGLLIWFISEWYVGNLNEIPLNFSSPLFLSWSLDNFSMGHGPNVLFGPYRALLTYQAILGDKFHPPTLWNKQHWKDTCNVSFTA